MDRQWGPNNWFPDLEEYIESITIPQITFNPIWMDDFRVLTHCSNLCCIRPLQVGFPRKGNVELLSSS